MQVAMQAAMAAAAVAPGRSLLHVRPYGEVLNYKDAVSMLPDQLKGTTARIVPNLASIFHRNMTNFRFRLCDRELGSLRCSGSFGLVC